MADGVAADTLPDPPICRAEDAVLYAVPRPAAQEYYRCTARDMQALRSYAPTDLAYRFRDALDPQLLCQSLFCMSAQYPKCFGRLVNVDGECMIRTNSHDPGLRALPLPPSAVDSRAQWQRVLDAFPLREPGFAGNRLFQALLLHTPDPGDGCVLLLTVDHMLGDAGTCAALAKALSAHYRELSGASAAAVMAAPAPDRHAALAAEVSGAGSAVISRRFHFRAADLAPVRACVADGAPDVTLNDVLMAICACALAPFRAPELCGNAVRLALMADGRGRGLPVDFVGNAAVPLHVYVDWDTLRSHDLGAVARAIRRSVAEGLLTLPAACAADPVDPPAQKPLLTWTSWARARGLLEADFGMGLRRFEWMNSYSIGAGDCFSVIPVTDTGGLCLLARLPETEMDHLGTVWDSMIHFQGPAAAQR